MDTSVSVVLVDVSPKMIKAWREVFEDNPEVTVVHGSILDQKTTAWVNPTNARAIMEGGVDGVMKKHFGPKIQTRVQSEIARLFGGALPVGHATCVETGVAIPRFLISTPTMHATSEDVSDTLNVVLAASAALQRVHMQNKKVPGSITSVAIPGLGTNTGKVPVEIAADLMWTAYALFREKAFDDFKSMREALEESLGSLGNSLAPGGAHAAKPSGPKLAVATPGLPGIAAAPPTTAPTPPAGKPLTDFDDHE
ncbi:MAG: macro domain-containing protein [Deltaproteobacteria bacterium]|nr:macro domain-containing protein [Deltaproteobacteria bacterium]